MQRWTRIGDFVLTDDRFEIEAMRGTSAQAMLGLIREDSIEAQDLRRFLWELGYYDIHRQGHHQVLSALEHCLRTGVVGVLPWTRMQEILFTPGSFGGKSQRDANTGGSAGPIAPSRRSQKPPTPPSKPPPKDMPAPATRIDDAPKDERQTTRDINSKAVRPQSLTDARAILATRREEIALKGYEPKYTDEELLSMAQLGEVASERFHVRFMEKTYLQHRDAPSVPLSGAMGGLLEGATGKGAKYWSTTLDQIEDADTDPRLLCEKLGIEYDALKEYVLIIMDIKKAAPLTAVRSIPATFAKVGEFAHTERPQNFTKAFTAEVMTPEFQAEYAGHYEEAVRSGFLRNRWSRDTAAFETYLKTCDLPASEIKTLVKRMDMHDVIGNNQDYLGTGVTKNLIAKSQKKFGVVETLNLERREVSLQQLQDAGAIAILKDLTPTTAK